MKTLLKYLEDSGYIIDNSYYYESTKVGSIFCKKINGTLTTMITIRKDYKGYKVEKAEFIGESFGKVRKFETKTINDVVKGLCL